MNVLETSFSQNQGYFTFIYLTTFGQSKIAYFASYDPPEFLTLVNTYCRQSITKCWIGGSVKKSSRPSLNVNNLSLSLWSKVVSEAETIYVSSGLKATGNPKWIISLILRKNCFKNVQLVKFTVTSLKKPKVSIFR